MRKCLIALVLLFAGCTAETMELCPYTASTGAEHCVEFMECRCNGAECLNTCWECTEYEYFGQDEPVQQWPFIVEACENGNPVPPHGS